MELKDYRLLSGEEKIKYWKKSIDEHIRNETKNCDKDCSCCYCEYGADGLHHKIECEGRHYYYYEYTGFDEPYEIYNDICDYLEELYD